MPLNQFEYERVGWGTPAIPLLPPLNYNYLDLFKTNTMPHEHKHYIVDVCATCDHVLNDPRTDADRLSISTVDIRYVNTPNCPKCGGKGSKTLDCVLLPQGYKMKSIDPYMPVRDAIAKLSANELHYMVGAIAAIFASKYSEHPHSGVIAYSECLHTALEEWMCQPSLHSSTTSSTSEAPLAKQVGGQHYKGLAIQPVEYAHANKLDFFQGSIVKYVTRFREKNGISDLNKAIHFIEMLKDLEYHAPEKAQPTPTP